MNKLYNNKVLGIFIILQPIIDIITSIMINEYNTNISIGMIIRFFFLIYALVYLYKYKDKKTIIYLLIWLLYISINLIGNFIIKDNFIIVSQLKLLLKMVYFPISLLFFYKYFKNNNELDSNVFTHTAMLVGISLLLSSITNTSYCTYDAHINCFNDGTIAWFNSANEYGLILIALLGLTLSSFIKKINIFNILSLSAIIIFLTMLGTKASFIGLIGILGAYVGYYIITYFIDKNKFKNIYKVLFLIVVIFSVLISTPVLPITSNLQGTKDRRIDELNNGDCENCCLDLLNGEDPNESESVRTTLVFNGRDNFININKNFYKKSNIFNKLFGITSQGNYLDGNEYFHINERDFHDLLIFYGIIGLLIELLLPLSLIVSLVKKVLKNIKVIFDEEFIIYGLIISFILLGSFMAGHCLFSPAVSFYLALMINLLIKKAR